MLEIWTDVSGMMTADPRLVSRARPIARPLLSGGYGAVALRGQGAVSAYHSAGNGARHSALDQEHLRSRPTTAPWWKWPRRTAPRWCAACPSIGNLSLLNLEGSGMVGIPGFSKRLFEALARERINVVLITQSSSEYSICVGLAAADAPGPRPPSTPSLPPKLPAGASPRCGPKTTWPLWRWWAKT
ncbi:MAG: hypothetical protein WKG07_29560 [Hymenobacter sp.]